MTLDDRARQAAAAIKKSVGSAELMLLEAGVPGARKSERVTARTRALAFSVAFAVVVVVVGLALLPGRLFAPDDSNVAGPGSPATTPGVANSLPEDAPPGTAPSSLTSDGSNTKDPTSGLVSRNAPDITITAPADGEVVTDESVEFRGTVEPGARVFARTSDLAEASVDADGNWSITLLVQAPATTALFFAEDAAGNRSNDVAVTVTYIPPSPDSTLVPDPTVAFAATAQVGSRTDEPLFDVYSGTANPNDRIRVESEYGQGGVRADADGEWSIRVTFRGAQLNETFTVTVTNLDMGELFEFEFTRVEQDG